MSDRKMRELQRKIVSLPEPDNLPYVSQLNILRTRMGETFPAIKIGDYWHEVEHTEKLFEPNNEYVVPTGKMGLLRLKNKREFYFFKDERDLYELIKNIEYLQEYVAGNYALFNIPSQHSGYTSDAWGDDYEGVSEAGWYFYVDNYNGGEDQGPYETEAEVIDAYTEAEEEMYPDNWKREDRQHIYNAETVHEFWKHPGIEVYADSQEYQNEYSQKFAEWLEYDFNDWDFTDSLWLVPTVKPPFKDKPEWIDWYR